MAGKAVYRKLATKFGADAAKSYLYGSNDAGIQKDANGELQQSAAKAASSYDVLADKQRAELARLEKEFYDKFDANPRAGHGGTPDILDNSKGRMMKRAYEKYNDQLRGLKEKIEKQKQKIEKTEARKAYYTTQTKKSKKRMESKGEPIPQKLNDLAKAGKLKQWARNPDLFFVPGMDKVAVTYNNGKLGISKKYPAKTKEEFDTVMAMLKT